LDYFKKEVVLYKMLPLTGQIFQLNETFAQLCFKHLAATPEPLKRHLKVPHPLEFAVWASNQQEAKKADLERKKVAEAVDAAVKIFKTPRIVGYMQETPNPINSSEQKHLDF
jgi:hypothetical protein